MTISGRKVLTEFSATYPETKESIEAFTLELKKASWSNPNELKEQYGSASILGKGCIVFNICGVKYRIVAKIDYLSQIVIIRWAGRHKEYDKLDLRGTKCLSSN